MNLIEQVVFYVITKTLDIAVTKALNQKPGPTYRCLVFVNKDLPNNVENIYKDWRLEEIEFFDLDYEELSFVVIRNCHGFYRDVYAFINRLKELAVL